MFTIMFKDGDTSESFECATYKVRKAIESDPNGTVKVVSFSYTGETGLPMKKTIELKVKQRIFAMNRFGATHESIEAFA